MKIVRIIARLNVGGPARHVVWLTKRLQNDGFESVLIAGSVPAGEEDMSYFARENGVEPVYVPQLSRELGPKDIVSLFKIYREIKRQKPDIIHTHTAKAGTLGRTAGFLYKWFTWTTLIGRPRSVKIVHTFHGHVFHSYYGRAKTQFFIAVERILGRIATDRIIAITDQQLNEINGTFGVGSRERFAVIPLGIDLERFSQGDQKSDSLRDEIKAGASDIVVGFVGRLTEIKDIPLLLDAFALYADSEGDATLKLKLAVIGDGHLRAQLESLAEKKGLSGNITFIGNRENVGDLIAGCDIVALSSLNEGTPLSLIEAMAAGRAVISTAVGGVVDLLGDTIEVFEGFSVRERGVAVETREPADFLKGLIYLAKNEKLRTSLAAAGRKFVHEKYSIDRLESDIVSLYRELASGDR